MHVNWSKVWTIRITGIYEIPSEHLGIVRPIYFLTVDRLTSQDVSRNSHRAHVWAWEVDQVVILNILSIVYYDIANFFFCRPLREKYDIQFVELVGYSIP